MEILQKTLMPLQDKKEEIAQLKEKLKKIKEQIYKLLADSDKDSQKFFDEIFNLQNEVLSSEDIRDARLEKEFNQILKVLNLLHSIQDNKIKTMKDDLLSLLQDYLETKEQLLELTEINCNSLKLIKETVLEIKKEINQIKNKGNKIQNIFTATFNTIGKALKHPLMQKIVGTFLLLIFMLLLMLGIKKIDKELYNDTKEIIKNTVKNSQTTIVQQTQ